MDFHVLHVHVHVGDYAHVYKYIAWQCFQNLEHLLFGHQQRCGHLMKARRHCGDT